MKPAKVDTLVYTFKRLFLSTIKDSGFGFEEIEKFIFRRLQRKVKKIIFAHES